jgi:hypothetical protein
MKKQRTVFTVASMVCPLTAGVASPDYDSSYRKSRLRGLPSRSQGSESAEVARVHESLPLPQCFETLTRGDRRA